MACWVWILCVSLDFLVLPVLIVCVFVQLQIFHSHHLSKFCLLKFLPPFFYILVECVRLSIFLCQPEGFNSVFLNYFRRFLKCLLGTTLFSCVWSAGDLSEHSVSGVHFLMSSALLSPLTHRVSAVIIVFWTVFAEDSGLQLFI